MSELPILKISLINPFIRKINLLYKRENNTHTGNKYIYLCLSQDWLKGEPDLEPRPRIPRLHSQPSNKEQSLSKTLCEYLLVEGRVPFNRFSTRLLRKPEELHVSRVEDVHWDMFWRSVSLPGPPEKKVQPWCSPHPRSSFLWVGHPGPPQAGRGPISGLSGGGRRLTGLRAQATSHSPLMNQRSA